ncbi:class IV adenylate cyclase [Vibrio sp. JC009]|uniref:class IV adenylate cyclase n=1 Tax=Vibrio sp. JC009 TaxID=2912314 RepID=UPI0023B06D0D|nr:class IV adenylate cyclase [Vibrio sp. JC009]WED24128.1 class IV adenylate cyclase [Vibrio sp. JC009]
MSSDHFQGKYEVELKYRLKSKSDFLHTLRQMPHKVMLEDNAEFDKYYDTPDRKLSAQNKSLCIRTMEPSGIKLWIVKGPEPDRCEATNIMDANSASGMLETLGYEVSLQARKVRSIYFIDEYHITVDSLDNIGDFAEFAIMTDEEERLSAYRKELEKLAFKFGLTDQELEPRSYKDMVTESAE